MLSPADLMEQAEEFSSRIPPTPEYIEDRNGAWLAIGQAWLKLNDGAGAMRALGRLDHGRCQAVLRHAIAMWTGEHMDFEPGREMVRDTALHIERLGLSFNRRELSDFVFPLFRVCGEQVVRLFADRIEDPFSASNVLVTLSHFARDPETRRDILTSAERRASMVPAGVPAGDRDYALRWVYDGYRAAGLEQDAQRVSAAMKIAPKTMDEPMLAAEKTLEAARQFLEQHEPETPPDTQIARLRRFIEYKLNHLKVQYLADMAEAGGLVDPEIEALLAAEPFQKIETPQAPSIYRDPSRLDAVNFARFLFDRPARLDEADRELLEGNDYFADGSCDSVDLVKRATELFESFGTIAPLYSMKQVDQGLWLLLGWRFSLPEALRATQLSTSHRQQCIDAMVCPFRDYYALCGDRYSGSVFYMWWDLLGSGREALSVLEQLIALPSAPCQKAALHGLNHLHPDPDAFLIVNRYIEDNRARMTADEIAEAEAYRDGREQ